MSGNKIGQQEIVGFVLIVVLVVVGLMVFLIFSAKNSGEDEDSLEVANLLSVIMRYTMDCNAQSTLRADSLSDLFKSCSEKESCFNLKRDSCEYLNESLRGVLAGIMASESTVLAYQLEFFEQDATGNMGILDIFEGNCSSGKVVSSQREIKSSKNLIIRLKICKEN